MTLNEFVVLTNAKKVGIDKYKALCPCHNDKTESLSIGLGRNKKILLHCQAGCQSSDIVKAYGITFKDLNTEYVSTQRPTFKSVTRQSKTTYQPKEVEAIYNYDNDTRKIRYKDKSFKWEHLEKNNWISGKGNSKNTLYKMGDNSSDTVYIVEGEKDCCTLAELGFYSASAENGAGNDKWKAEEYNPQIKNKRIRIIQDNDEIGKLFARTIAQSLSAENSDIKIFDISRIWKQIPEHADITDYFERFGRNTTIDLLQKLEEETRPFRLQETKQPTTKRSIQSILKELKPESIARYKQTDLGNGNLFADVFKNVARFSADRNCWYVYNGKYWKADSGVQVMQLCKKLADNLLDYGTSVSIQDNGKFIREVGKWQNRKQRETILKDAQSVYPVYVSDFDKDPFLFNCQNGTLNLDTMEFHEHKFEDMLTKISNVNYDKSATCTRFLTFIKEIMSGDTEKAEYLQKALGYTLTGDSKEECFFILYGATSRNGKGTLMETYKTLMGGYGRATSPETISQKDRADGSKPSEDVARLQGARFVNISEPDKSMVLSSALIKTLTGNDTITARFLREQSFEFKPQFKIFVNTNHLPRVTDDSVFSSDRIKVIPFERHFEENERDKDLKSFFAQPQNQSAILNWCIEGLKKYKESGLKIPESIRIATDTYRVESDVLLRFMNEELEQGCSYEESTSTVYERYREWCFKYNFKATSLKTFGEEIRKKNVEVKIKRANGKGNPVSTILGYRIRDNEQAITGFNKISDNSIDF